MGKFFNETMKNKNFPFRKVSLGPSFAEERRGNLEVRRQPEPSGDLSPIGRDERAPEQSNSATGRIAEDGPVGEGLPSKSSSPKARAKRQRNRATRRRN